jgi:hypothetical protein
MGQQCRFLSQIILGQFFRFLSPPDLAACAFNPLAQSVWGHFKILGNCIFSFTRPDAASHQQLFSCLKHCRDAG